MDQQNTQPIQLRPPHNKDEYPDEELLQCFDEAGNPTEARLRSEVKQQPPRFWYGVARVWVVNAQGELLISKRSDKLAAAGGQWSTWFGGHVGAGETLQATARRELQEEAGLTLPIEEFFLVDQGRKDDKKVFFANYAVRFNGSLDELRIHEAEVAEVKWLSMADSQLAAAAHPERWANHLNDQQHQIVLNWLAR